MKNGLLEKIKSRGYWRINFQPNVYPQDKLTLNECREAVEKNAVELRGWDYPHIPRRNDDDSASGPAGDYYEGWIDWEQHIEFWRMYKSRQFLHYLALRDDWFELSKWDRQLQAIRPGTSLGIVGSIYQITEVFEFASRLTRHGLYKEGLNIKIDLNNTTDRALRIDDPMRMRFSYPRKTHAENIVLERRVTADEVILSGSEVALGVLLELFDHFGWVAPRDIIAADQSKFVAGRAFA